MSFHGSASQIITAANIKPISSVSLPSIASSLFRRSSMAKQPCGRRPLFSFLVAAAAGAAAAAAAAAAATPLPQGTASKNALLQEYLKRSRENKEKYDKERLDGYYKRNYRDYFEFVEGASKDKSDDLLTETEKEIRQWLRSNK